jgi:hypothetical protein
MADDINVENKTQKLATDMGTIEVSASRYKKTPTNFKKENVLNNFRSYTYNFTLAVVSDDDRKNSDAYDGPPLNFIIAKSGGKGSKGLPNTSDAAAKKRQADLYASDIEPTAEAISAAKAAVTSANASVGFNANSPGRFDFYIDNLEIDTNMAFSAQSSVTMPTKLIFEVIEPYSINGFLEALHFASLAAGYPNYANGGFVLKLEFLGYPDNADLSVPTVVPKSTRYFFFRFYEIQMELTEKGTKYRCACTPDGQKAFGQANVLKEPVSLKGKTVQESLENFFKNINEQLVAADKSGKAGASAGNHDIYEIQFPDIVAGKESGTTNDISKAQIAVPLRENQLYAFLDPATSKLPNAMKTDISVASSIPADYVMKDTQIQFSEGRLISEAIAAVVRDSTFVRDIAKDMKSKIDTAGFVNYFTIKTQTISLKKFDAASRRPFMKYIFKVTPYRIHYTSFPGYEAIPFEAKKLDPYLWRRYNYLYTGKNIDVLNFKLNFNLAFTSEIPKGNANNDTPGAARGAAPESSVEVKRTDTNIAVLKSDQTSGGSVATTPNATSISRVADGTAGQVSDDPYWTIARNMHASIVTQKGAALVLGDLEILGDPFYLVTGGIGNNTPPEENPGITTNGEASYLAGQVLISLEFRTPQDIGTLAEGGLLKFQDTSRAPFGGIFRVSKVSSTLKDGQFKQVLSIERMQGQVSSDSKTTPGDVGAATVTSPDKIDKPMADTTKAIVLSPLAGAALPSVPAALTNPLAAVTAGVVSAITSKIPSLPSIPAIPIPAIDIKIPVIQPPTIAPLPELSVKDIAGAANFASGLAAKAAEMASAVNSSPLKSIADTVKSKFG